MPEERSKPDYSYVANANLVLQQDRREFRRLAGTDGDELGHGFTGEAESLFGRINPQEMGSKAVFEKPPIFEKKKKKRISAQSSSLSLKTPSKQGSSGRLLQTLLHSNKFEGLLYRPKSSNTLAVYEIMLGFLHQKYLPDASEETLRGALDDVLTIMKGDQDSDHRKDLDKKREVEEWLCSGKEMDVEEYGQLLALCNRITDYHASAEETTARSLEEEGVAGTTKRTSSKFGELKEEEVGMAIVFDEDDEDEYVGDELIEEEEESDVSDDADDGIIKVDEPAIVSAQDIINIKKLQINRDSCFVDIRSVDAYWLQRQLSQHITDSHECLAISQQVFVLLENSVLSERRGIFLDADENREDAIRHLENELLALLDYDKFSLIKTLLLNRKTVVYGMLLASANASERDNLLKDIEADIPEGPKLLAWLSAPLGQEPTFSDDILASTPQEGGMVSQDIGSMKDFSSTPFSNAKLPLVPLENFIFKEGPLTMTNKRVNLPINSWKQSHPGYEEIHIPAPSLPSQANGMQSSLVAIKSLPEWTHPAFSNATKTLNRIQSAVLEKALNTSDNLLVCAPTGAGKTNIALLTVLHCLGEHGAVNQRLDKSLFKIVYVAPMKALVQEMVATFSARLQPYGIRVSELSGDKSLTSREIQQDVQMLVTTPEKWDIITRKCSSSLLASIKLLIIDEIHLLHDDRGPVLESIVVRFKKSHAGIVGIGGMPESSTGTCKTRLVGLSATLPNFKDVAEFLNVPKDAVFHFDASYRPCPLSMNFLGINEKKPLKKRTLLNKLTFNKVTETLQSKHSILVFVHSRKDTAITARYFIETALKDESIAMFLVQKDATFVKHLELAGENASNPELKYALPFGIGLHHAGLALNDRRLVEELFANNYLSCLISTATLAWGVNLPAHTVLIKGTEVYNPNAGAWTCLSGQDMLQMLGRAGRPQYDASGHGFVLTDATSVQYYLSLLTAQLPIESQLARKLPECLNAEIANGTITDVSEALDWLYETYYYIRASNSPDIYNYAGLNSLHLLLHSTLSKLAGLSCIHYDSSNPYSSRLETTALGRIASSYYLNTTTIAIYSSSLRPNLSLPDLLRVFTKSNEFSTLVVRLEEKAELAKLLEMVPIPIKETNEDPSAKINVLLQAYLSGLKCSGFALRSDMIYVTQSAGRLLSAILELALCRGWTNLVNKCLYLTIIHAKKTWKSSSPIRQFLGTGTGHISGKNPESSNIPISSILTSSILRALEKKDLPLHVLNALTIPEIGELVKLPSTAEGYQTATLLHRMVHMLPLPNVSQVEVKPLTSNILSVQLNIQLPVDFIYDPLVHGNNPTFGYLLLVSDPSIDDEEEEDQYHGNKMNQNIGKKDFEDNIPENENMLEFTSINTLYQSMESAMRGLNIRKRTSCLYYQYITLSAWGQRRPMNQIQFSLPIAEKDEKGSLGQSPVYFLQISSIQYHHCEAIIPLNLTTFEGISKGIITSNKINPTLSLAMGSMEMLDLAPMPLPRIFANSEWNGWLDSGLTTATKLQSNVLRRLASSAAIHTGFGSQSTTSNGTGKNINMDRTISTVAPSSLLLIAPMRTGKTRLALLLAAQKWKRIIYVSPNRSKLQLLWKDIYSDQFCIPLFLEPSVSAFSKENTNSPVFSQDSKIGQKYYHPNTAKVHETKDSGNSFASSYSSKMDSSLPLIMFANSFVFEMISRLFANYNESHQEREIVLSLGFSIDKDFLSNTVFILDDMEQMDTPMMLGISRGLSINANATINLDNQNPTVNNSGVHEINTNSISKSISVSYSSTSACFKFQYICISAPTTVSHSFSEWLHPEVMLHYHSTEKTELPLHFNENPFSSLLLDSTANNTVGTVSYIQATLTGKRILQIALSLYPFLRNYKDNSKPIEEKNMRLPNNSHQSRNIPILLVLVEAQNQPFLEEETCLHLLTDLLDNSSNLMNLFKKKYCNNENYLSKDMSSNPLDQKSNRYQNINDKLSTRENMKYGTDPNCPIITLEPAHNSIESALCLQLLCQSSIQVSQLGTLNEMDNHMVIDSIESSHTNAVFLEDNNEGKKKELLCQIMIAPISKMDAFPISSLLGVLVHTTSSGLQDNKTDFPLGSSIGKSSSNRNGVPRGSSYELARLVSLPLTVLIYSDIYRVSGGSSSSSNKSSGIYPVASFSSKNSSLTKNNLNSMPNTNLSVGGHSIIGTISNYSSKHFSIPLEVELDQLAGYLLSDIYRIFSNLNQTQASVSATFQSVTQRPGLLAEDILLASVFEYFAQFTLLPFRMQENPVFYGGGSTYHLQNETSDEYSVLAENRDLWMSERLSDLSETIIQHFVALGMLQSYNPSIETDHLQAPNDNLGIDENRPRDIPYNDSGNVLPERVYYRFTPLGKVAASLPLDPIVTSLIYQSVSTGTKRKGLLDILSAAVLASLPSFDKDALWGILDQPRFINTSLTSRSPYEEHPLLQFAKNRGISVALKQPDQSAPTSSDQTSFDAAWLVNALLQRYLQGEGIHRSIASVSKNTPFAFTSYSLFYEKSCEKLILKEISRILPSFMILLGSFLHYAKPLLALVDLSQSLTFIELSLPLKPSSDNQGTDIQRILGSSDPLLATFDSMYDILDDHSKKRNFLESSILPLSGKIGLALFPRLEISFLDGRENKSDPGTWLVKLTSPDPAVDLTPSGADVASTFSLSSATLRLSIKREIDRSAIPFLFSRSLDGCMSNDNPTYSSVCLYQSSLFNAKNYNLSSVPFTWVPITFPAFFTYPCSSFPFPKLETFYLALVLHADNTVITFHQFSMHSLKLLSPGSQSTDILVYGANIDLPLTFDQVAHLADRSQNGTSCCTLYMLSDGWLGADQELQVQILHD